MSNLTSYSRSARLAQILGGFNLLLSSVGIALSFVTGGLELDTYILTFILTAISYSLLAISIIRRHPKHIIGWIFLVIGSAPSFAFFLLALYTAFPQTESGLFYRVGQWFGTLAFFPTYLVPLTLVLQYFPTGNLPSRRWRLLPILTIIGIGSMLSAMAFHPWPWEATDAPDLNNPFGIPGSEFFFEQLLEFAYIAFAISLFGSLAAMLVRYYYSKGIERVQMKWLVYTAVIGITALLFLQDAVSFLAGTVLGLEPVLRTNSLGDIVLLLLPVLFSLAIGIAILRHRLFDIDVIIRRTLQYTILTGILALVYFGLVILLQIIFSAVEDQQSPIFIVISTLVIAALFNPLRQRLQEIIDRRFYRKKYESEQALAQFASTARDEVDLDELSSALLGVVQETIQPQSISLWLIQADQDR